MKALRYHDPRDIRHEDMADPVPHLPTDAIVRATECR
jgi:hypothetical protein